MRSTVPAAVGEGRLLFEALKTQTATALTGMLGGFFEGIRLQAYEAWMAQPNARARQDDRDAATALDQRNSQFAQAWRARMESDFDTWLQALPAAASSHGLSLVPEAQLRMQLYLLPLAETLDAELAGVLESLEARMSHLASALGGAPHGPAPIRPFTLGMGFIAGFGGEEAGESLGHALVHEFGTRLAPVLSGLLPELDRQLDLAGFAPQRAGGNARNGSASSVQRTALADTPAAEGNAAGWVPDGGVVAHERSHMPVAFDAGAAQVEAAAVAPAIPAEPLPAATITAAHASPPPAQAPADEGVPMRYRDIVHQQLRYWRTAVGQPPANDADHQDVLGAQALRTVASLLQGDDASDFVRALTDDGGRLLAVAIRDAVGSGARQLGLASGALQFAPDQEDAIDLVAMLFEGLLHTRQAGTAPQGDAVARLYARLVIPYLKVALLDDSLFNRRTHPARRLLDAVTEACEDDPGDGAGVSMAEQAVNRIVTDFTESLAIFDLALDELQHFQQQRRRRADLAERRAAEALAGRERLDHARSRSQAVLQAWFANQPMTDAVAGFLRGPWRHAYEQALLRPATDCTALDPLLALGEALLRLDTQAASSTDGHAVADAWLEIEPQMEACGAGAGLDHGARAMLAARMVFAFAHPDTARRAQSLGDEPGTQDADIAALALLGGPESVPHDPALAERMRRLRPGQALRLVDAAGRDCAARVAWISPLTARVLLVNARGQRLLVASPERLAALVAAGRLALRAPEPPFDRAMKRVWQQLNRAQGEPLSASA